MPVQPQFADTNAMKCEPRQTIPHEQSVTTGHATVQASADRWLRQDVLGPHAEKLPWGGSQQSQKNDIGQHQHRSCRIGGPVPAIAEGSGSLNACLRVVREAARARRLDLECSSSVDRDRLTRKLSRASQGKILSAPLRCTGNFHIGRAFPSLGRQQVDCGR